MKTIGLIGGMSWESSMEYYRIINEAIYEKLGGLHSAKIIMSSVDFAEIEPLQHQGRWEEATKLMIAAARQVESGGADFLIICTNTMHKMANDIQKHINIPLLHIADATAEKIKAQGLRRIGLLGTKFTMEEDFYRGRLSKKYGLEVIVPGAEGIILGCTEIGLLVVEEDSQVPLFDTTKIHALAAVEYALEE